MAHRGMALLAAVLALHAGAAAMAALPEFEHDRPQFATGIPKMYERFCDPSYTVTHLSQPYARDAGYGIGVFEDGRVVVSGDSYRLGFAGESDYVTVAYDARGRLLWRAIYDGPNRGPDHPYSLAVDEARDAVYVTGWSEGDWTGYDYATVAYDASTGRQRWVARHDGPAGAHDFAWSVRLSPDGGRVYVTGYATDPQGSADYNTVAYDPGTGAELWMASWDGPASALDIPYLLSVAPDGSRVYVVGRTSTSDRGTEFGTVAYDAATGQQLWSALDGSPNDDVGWEVVPSPRGDLVFVTGYSRTYQVIDYTTIAYRADTGEQVWRQEYLGPGGYVDIPVGLRVSPDGGQVFVAGASVGRQTRFDFATVAYDAATGVQRWVARTEGHPWANDFAFAMDLTPDGRSVIVTGCSQAAAPLSELPLELLPGSGAESHQTHLLPVQHPDYDLLTASYDAEDGSVNWVQRFDGPARGYDAAWGVDAGPGGAVAITGWVEDPYAGYDMVTMVYDEATGQPRWRAQEDRSRGT